MQARVPEQRKPINPFRCSVPTPRREREKVESLYKALNEAKKKSGEKVSGNLDSFAAFVKKKTTEIRKQAGCDSVVYSVEMQDGRVKLKAKAKKLEKVSVLSSQFSVLSSQFSTLDHCLRFWLPILFLQPGGEGLAVSQS